MKLFLGISVLLLLAAGTLTQDGFDLGDALDDPVPPTEKPKEQPKPTEKPKSDGGLDLADAFGPADPATVKPKQPSSGDAGGGGSFGDSDLFDIGGGYKPDAGHPNAGGGADPDQDTHGGADPPQEAGSGKIAGIVSAIGVALLGAASSFFAYQKKKLCFKIQGGADPEKGHQGTQSDPQVFSNLLKTS